MALTFDNLGNISTTFIEVCKKRESQIHEIVNGVMRITAQQILNHWTRRCAYRNEKGKNLSKAEQRFERKL